MDLGVKFTEPRARVSLCINANWSFRFVGETDHRLSRTPAGEPGWHPIALPHTWSTYEFSGALHPFIRDAGETDNPAWWRGWGWYRKEIRISSAHRGRRVFLEFDGVQKFCRVYANGAPVAEHKGGFTSFSVDITDHVNFDSITLLAVEVSNKQTDEFGGIPPMHAGNWDVYGGIYRDVRLVLTDSVYVPFQGSAEHEGGTHIATPRIADGDGSVAVRTFLRNARDRRVTCSVRTVLCDQSDAVCAESTVETPLDPGAITEVAQTVGKIQDPQLWSPDDPSVYTAYTILTVDGQRVDDFASPFGFRWFHWDYQSKQLHLNGRPIHIHGTNRHQEYPWLGDAVPKWLHIQELEDIKYNLGHNFLRTCHYPQDPIVYDLCDRLGIIACEEVPNIKSIQFDDAVQRQNVVEMIRRDRNHPSILFWSMGNETTCAADGAWAREEDPTRITHFRKVVGRGEDEPHNSDQIDMENLLRCTIRGWPDHDVAGFDYGAPVEDAENGQVTGTEEWQHQMARVDGGSVRGRIDKNNTVLWLYADHGADREYKRCPLKHVNPKGLLDAYRVPKYLYHLWKANYSAQPMVYVHPHYWQQAYDGTEQDFVVDSNCPTVQLVVNGTLFESRRVGASDFHTVTFHRVPVQPGTITAVGTYDGGRVRHAVTMAGAAARLSVSASHTQLMADRGGIVIVTVDVVDAAGTSVYGARPTLHFEVEGPATLVGPSVLESDMHRSEETTGTMYITTPVRVPIRSSARAGTIVVRVHATELESGKVQLRAVPAASAVADGIELPQVQAGSVPVGEPAAAVAGQQSKDTDPGHVGIIYEDLAFATGERDSYRRQLDQFIRDRNPSVNTRSPLYHRLLQELAELAARGNGTLVADDFNFAASKHNQSLGG
jgi:hypothetical protein